MTRTAKKKCANWWHRICKKAVIDIWYSECLGIPPEKAYEQDYGNCHKCTIKAAARKGRG